jgi:hypothetical protein
MMQNGMKMMQNGSKKMQNGSKMMQNVGKIDSKKTHVSILYIHGN